MPEDIIMYEGELAIHNNIVLVHVEVLLYL